MIVVSDIYMYVMVNLKHLTWQWLFCYEDCDACSPSVIIASAVQMGEPEVGHERGSVVEDRATLDVWTLQRPHLAGDAVTRVFVQRHCASAVEPARNHGIHDGEYVVGDEAAAKRARLAAGRASDRGLEAADARVAHDVAVEALLNRWQADAPAYRAAHAVIYPLSFRWGRSRVRVERHYRDCRLHRLIHIDRDLGRDVTTCCVGVGVGEGRGGDAARFIESRIGLKSKF